MLILCSIYSPFSFIKFNSQFMKLLYGGMRQPWLFSSSPNLYYDLVKPYFPSHYDIMMFDDTMALPETTKMAHLSDLPSELLNIIITFLVMSSSDMTDWARVYATCKKFKDVAIQPNILRSVNCQNVMVVNHPEQHHHINGLISLCVQAGNLSAECMMAKVVLLGGAPLWEKIIENDLTNSSIKCATSLPLSERRTIAKSLNTGSIVDLPYIFFSLEDQPHSCASYGTLHYSRLIRSFVTLADHEDLIAMYFPLIDFIEFFVGYHKYTETGIQDITDDMFMFECKMRWYKCVTRRGKPIAAAMFEIFGEEMLPVGSTWYRDRFLLAFDNLFQQEALLY